MHPLGGSPCMRDLSGPSNVLTHPTGGAGGSGRTMRVVEGLHLPHGRLPAGVHQADVALAAHRDQGVRHGQAHHLLAVLQPHLRMRAQMLSTAR